VLLLFAACGSTTTAAPSANKPPVTEYAVSNIQLPPFCGVWDKKYKDINLTFVFSGHTFTLFANDVELIRRGIVRHTDTEMILHHESNYELNLAYSLQDSKLILNGASEDESWINGEWILFKGNLNTGNYFLVGSWERIGSDSISIVQFYKDGEGIYYSCTTDYIIKSEPGIVTWKPGTGFFTTTYGNISIDDKYKQQSQDTMLVNGSVIYKKVGSF